MEKIETSDLTKHFQVHLQKEPVKVDIHINKLSPKQPDFDLKRNIKQKIVKLD